MKTQKIGQGQLEKLLSNEKQTIYGQMDQGTLRIKVVIKQRDFTIQNYECVIKESDLDGKLSEYFEHLNELKQYIKIMDHVKIDQQKQMLDIIAKGPTKRTSYILLAQFKLRLIDRGPKNSKDLQVCSETEEWIDNLTNEIISIIQCKSKIKEKEVNANNFVTKNQMIEAMTQLRAEFEGLLQNKSFDIQKQNKKILRDVQGFKIEQQEKMKKISSQEEVIEKLKNNQLLQIQNQIKELTLKIQRDMEKMNFELRKKINQESEKLFQKTREQLGQKMNEIYHNFSTKDEIDAIIKKMQSIGNKLQSLTVQSLKKAEKEIFNEKLYMQQKKISEIEQKIQKSKSLMEASPKRSPIINQFTPTGVSAQSWVDPGCSHYGRVNLKENTITMISYGNARLFGKIPIKQKPIFHILINSMANRMTLGVIDPSYKENVIFGEEPNLITYQSDKKSWNGKKQKSEQGEGFKAEQTVTVSVDIALGTILWKVGNNLRYSWQNDELRNGKIKWVPYVKLFDKGDKISLVQ